MGDDKSGKNNERRKTIRRHTDLEVYRSAAISRVRLGRNFIPSTMPFLACLWT